MNKYTITQLESMHVTKGELFAFLKNDKSHEFDYALPQDFLFEFSDYCKKYFPEVTYDLIRSCTVWVYPESAPLTLCLDVENALNDYCIRHLLNINPLTNNLLLDKIPVIQY